MGLSSCATSKGSAFVGTIVFVSLFTKVPARRHGVEPVAVRIPVGSLIWVVHDARLI